MSSKLIFYAFILTLIILSACGVKGPPSPPQGTNIPSYIEKFTTDSSTSTTTQKENPR